MGDSFLEAGLYFGSPRIFQVGFSINPNPFSPPDSRASLAFSHKNTGNRRQNRINQFQDLFCDVLIGLIFYHNVIVKSNDSPFRRYPTISQLISRGDRFQILSHSQF